MTLSLMQKDLGKPEKLDRIICFLSSDSKQVLFEYKSEALLPTALSDYAQI